MLQQFKYLQDYYFILKLLKVRIISKKFKLKAPTRAEFEPAIFLKLFLLD